MSDKIHRHTIKDVAKLAGVSVSTASLAFNNKEKVRKKTYDMVMAAANELNYSANISAKALRTAKTNMIGLIVPDITNIFYSVMVDKIREYVERRGYFLLLGITGNKIKNEKKYVSEFIGRNVDGIIIMPMLKYVEDTSHLDEISKYELPLVFLSAKYSNVSAPTVMCDLATGVYEMAAHLLKNGLSDIHLIIGDRRVDTEYLVGFERALQEYGFSFDESKVHESDFSLQSALAVSEDILNRSPQAIMTVSDLMACAAVQAARNKGLSIPDDIAITGFDDVLYASINQTPISTVRQPIEEMCKKSTDILFSMIEGEFTGSSEEFLPPTLVYRDTTP